MVSVRQIRRISESARASRPLGPFTRSPRGSVFTPRRSDHPYSVPLQLQAFGFRLEGAGLLTIYEGVVELGEIGTYVVPEAELTLIGDTEYVFAFCAKQPPVLFGVDRQTTLPTSGGGYARMLLYKFVKVTDLPHWELSRDYRMGFHIHAVF